MKGPLFYAKILLFGEYGIIKYSKGLSIPYKYYQGSLIISDDQGDRAQESIVQLRALYQYLKALNDADVNLRLDEMKRDIDRNMHFDSSIPQGNGVGSSGALVAAVYDKYADDKITVLENLTRDTLLKLKSIFSKMESFFHGKSSGLDPLNSYLSLPILINSKDNLEPTGIPSQAAGKGAVFLLDSEIIGETEPMVKIFMNKM